MKKVGFIGAGQMAQALAVGMAQAYEDIQFEIMNPSDGPKQQFCAKVHREVVIRPTGAEIISNCDVVILAFKPQSLTVAIDSEQVAGALKNAKKTPVFVSILAGVTIAQLKTAIGVDNVIRVMPNTPSLIQEGASGIAAAAEVAAEDLKVVTELFEAVGEAVVVPEKLIDSVTGVSGSGPAYVYTFLEAMIDGGVLNGLPRPLARKLAIQTVVGAARMVADTGEHPAVLRDQVTSPGGTTIEAVRQLEKHGLRNAVIQAVESATLKAKQMGKS